jgi:membrane protease YdiL (CAAX protease family)
MYREPLREPLGISFRLNRWFAVAWLVPPALAMATFGVSLLLPQVRFSPDMAGIVERYRSTMTPEQIAAIREQAAAMPVHPFWVSLLIGLVAGPTVNAVAGFGEELGWRGLLRRELGPMGFWRSSLLIGLIWGVWHAPVVLQGHNYPEHRLAGVAFMIVWCILLSPLIGYVTIKAGSVIAAAVFHGALNATAGLAIVLVEGGNDLLTGVTGLAGFVVLALANAVLYAVDRDPGGREEASHHEEHEGREG